MSAIFFFHILFKEAPVNINELLKKEYYTIQSVRTQKPYIDSSFRAYLFNTKTDAEAFLKLQTGIELEYSKAEVYTSDTLFQCFYTNGAKSVILTIPGETPFIIDLDKHVSQKCKILYNNSTNGYLLRAQQTNQRKYLRSLYGKNFFIPVEILERKTGEYPVLNYCIAAPDKGKNVYYIVFSSIKEFQNWASSVQSPKGAWRPMQITLHKLNGIRQGAAVIINPLTNKMLLSNQNINYLIEEGKTRCQKSYKKPCQ